MGLLDKLWDAQVGRKNKKALEKQNSLRRTPSGTIRQPSFESVSTVGSSSVHSAARRGHGTPKQSPRKNLLSSHASAHSEFGSGKSILSEEDAAQQEQGKGGVGQLLERLSSLRNQLQKSRTDSMDTYEASGMRHLKPFDEAEEDNQAALDSQENEGVQSNHRLTTTSWSSWDDTALRMPDDSLTSNDHNENNSEDGKSTNSSVDEDNNDDVSDNESNHSNEEDLNLNDSNSEIESVVSSEDGMESDDDIPLYIDESQSSIRVIESDEESSDDEQYEEDSDVSSVKSEEGDSEASSVKSDDEDSEVSSVKSEGEDSDASSVKSDDEDSDASSVKSDDEDSDQDDSSECNEMEDSDQDDASEYNEDEDPDQDDSSEYNKEGDSPDYDEVQERNLTSSKPSDVSGSRKTETSANSIGKKKQNNVARHGGEKRSSMRKLKRDDGKTHPTGLSSRISARVSKRFSKLTGRTSRMESEFETFEEMMDDEGDAYRFLRLDSTSEFGSVISDWESDYGDQAMEMIPEGSTGSESDDESVTSTYSGRPLIPRSEPKGQTGGYAPSRVSEMSSESQASNGQHNRVSQGSNHTEVTTVSGLAEPRDIAFAQLLDSMFDMKEALSKPEPARTSHQDDTNVVTKPTPPAKKVPKPEATNNEGSTLAAKSAVPKKVSSKKSKKKSKSSIAKPTANNSASCKEKTKSTHQEPGMPTTLAQKSSTASATTAGTEAAPQAKKRAEGTASAKPRKAPNPKTSTQLGGKKTLTTSRRFSLKVRNGQFINSSKRDSFANLLRPTGARSASEPRSMGSTISKLTRTHSRVHSEPTRLPSVRFRAFGIPAWKQSLRSTLSHEVLKEAGPSKKALRRQSRSAAPKQKSSSLSFTTMKTLARVAGDDRVILEKKYSTSNPTFQQEEARERDVSDLLSKKSSRFSVLKRLGRKPVSRMESGRFPASEEGAPEEPLPVAASEPNNGKIGTESSYDAQPSSKVADIPGPGEKVTEELKDEKNGDKQPIPDETDEEYIRKVVEIQLKSATKWTRSPSGRWLAP